MGIKYWRFIYDADSDSWEAITDQAFSPKEEAESFINNLQKAEQKLAKIQELIQKWNVAEISDYHLGVQIRNHLNEES